MFIDILKRLKRIPSRCGKVLKNNLNLVITGVNTDEKALALTFDDGPHPSYTHQILDILDKHQAKATFFVVGEAAEKCPDILKRMADSGHAIGNHTWSHVPIPLVERNKRRDQIKETKSVATSNDDLLFRPPWGFIDISSYIDLRLLGYNKIILWDLVADDWLNPPADEIFRKLDSDIKPGNIVLLHDNLYNAIKPEHAPRENLINGLDLFLAKNKSLYEFVTVPQLLHKGTPKYKYGLLKKNERDSAIPKEVNF